MKKKSADNTKKHAKFSSMQRIKFTVNTFLIEEYNKRVMSNIFRPLVSEQKMF